MMYVPFVMESALSTLQRWVARADDALSSQRRWLAILFVAAFVLKLIYIIQSAGALHVRVPVMDSQYYDETARDIAAGHLLRREAFFMGPLYPYFLSLVYLVFGRDFMIVRFLQIIGGAASVVLTFVLGKQVFRPITAFFAAVLLMMYGTMTFYEGLLLMTWMGTLLNLSVLVVLYRARGAADGVVRYALAGVLLGLSALARANVLVFVPVVLVWILAVVKNRRRVAQAVVFTVATFAMLLPATVHNYMASRDLVVVTSNAGLNFFIGNNEVATGIFYPLPEIDFVRDPTSRTYIERLLGKDLSPSGVSRYWFERSLAYVREHPAGEVRLLARKFALFFNGYEIPQIESYAMERGEYASLRVLFVSFWFLLGLGLTGFIFSLREWRRHFLVSGFVAVYALSVIAFFITARYRVQIAPMLALFAAHAVLGVAPRFLRSARRGFALVGTLALLLVLTQPGVFAMDEKEVAYRQHIHNARRLSELGEHKPALGEIDKAIALYPDFYEGYWQRAIIHIAENDQLKAVEDYSRALARKADVPTIHYDFAQTLRRLNMTDKAIAEYETAIDLDPVMVEAHNNLGIAYREAGRYADAVREFTRVIELDPRYAKAYNNLGACLAEAGRVDQAIVTFQRATQLFPDYANSYKNLAMAYVSIKRPRPAMEAVTAYLAMRPDDESAKELLEKLRTAVAADTVEGR